MLRRTGRKVVLAVNKIDTPNLPDDFYDFYELGLGEPIPISSANMLNLGDLLDAIIENFPEGAGTEEDESIKIAMIGKPNVGKSSLVNRLLGENRVIVSPIAGTTRDVVEEQVRISGTDYLLVADAPEGEAEALILKDVSPSDAKEAEYVVLEDEEELLAVMKVFGEMLEDTEIRL